jgi:hypothetical protein
MEEDDEIWDEHRWEEFLRESDRRTDQYIRYWDEYSRDHPMPEDSAPEAEKEAWSEALHAYIAEKMGWNDDDEEIPDWMQDIFDDVEADDDEDDEAWKSALEPGEAEYGSPDDIPVYRQAFRFGSDVLKWSDTIPVEAKDLQFVEFCSNALQVGAKIAGGHGFGYEPDALGGNIANVKRGLAAANNALRALEAMREAPFMRPADYRRLYEQAFELRNAVGIYVQQLRERFDRERGGE